MLVFLFFSILLLAPVLQGFWSFRTQFVFEAAGLFTGGLWLFKQAFSAGLPQCLRERKNLPLLGAAFFSLLGAVLSPLRPLVLADWWSFFFGLFILVLAGGLAAEQRKTADWGLRLAAWLMAFLSLYQALILKSSDVSASLANPNALALFVLMLIPMAILWRDFFLLGALIIVLIWTQSVAALLAVLAAAGVYAADTMQKGDFRKNRPLFAVLAVVAGVALWQLEPRSVLDRLLWWGAALKMFADAPMLGFGQGAFAWLYPAYHHPTAAGISSVYVHNYFIEFLAENGALACACWFWAVFSRLKAVNSLKKYGVIAALVHSMADFGLAVPANLFIFCYILSEPPACPRQTTGGSAEAVWRKMNKPAPLSLPAGRQKEAPAVIRPDRKTLAVFAALAVLISAQGLGIFFKQLPLERLHDLALSAYSAGDYAGAAKTLEAAATAEPQNPLIPRLQGQAWLAAGLEKNDRTLLFRSAAALERSLLLNPYNSGAYRDLEYIYALVGAGRLKADLLQRKKEFFKWE
ncbi:MAG: O-antigen ligase family protein [Elusimicrobia bacterium]|nr:O-antigen ligase family protein [Elusimicrobiota bacterium]